MQKIWVVVANSSKAIIYRAENVNELTEHGIFFHDESRLPNRELVSDRKGHETYPRTFGDSNTMEPKTSPKLKEGHLFADQIADFLEKGFNAGECEKIYLIVKPPFLGYLRNAIHPNVAKLISAEIQKDLTHFTAQQIREQLPLVL